MRIQRTSRRSPFLKVSCNTLHLKSLFPTIAVLYLMHFAYHSCFLALFVHFGLRFVEENPGKKLGDLEQIARDIMGHQCGVIRSNAKRYTASFKVNEKEKVVVAGNESLIYCYRWNFGGRMDFLQFIDPQRNATDKFISILPQETPKDAKLWNDILRVPRATIPLFGVSS